MDAGPRAEAVAAGGQAPADGGGLAAASVAAVAFLVLVAYAGTVADMAGIWARSGTFAHGFLVLPVALWLLVRGRHRVAAAPARVTWAAVPLLVLLVGLWVLAQALGVGVVAQFAVLLMVPAGVLVLLGPAVARAAAFPLGFALLAVPFGEFLMPALMDITAAGSVLLLQFTGVPVYRDGWLLSIPEGNFQVAEACSGVRYLIAAVATSVLFGHLFFATARKRLIFIGFTVVLTVLANVLRAYIIILLARLTDMRLAVGVDHFIYGWVLFSLLLAVLFWAGLRHADAPVAMATGPAPRWRLPATGGLVAAAAATVTVLATGSLVAGRLADGPGTAPGAVSAPAGLGKAPLAGVVPRPEWLRPGPADDALHLAYRGVAGDVGVHVFRAGPGREVGVLRPYLAEDGATLVADEAVAVGETRYRQVRLETAGRSWLVAYWFAVGGRQTANPVIAKAMELQTLLQGEHSRPALVAVALETTKLEQPDRALQEIVAQAITSPCLNGAAGQADPEPAGRCRTVADGDQQG